MPASPDPPPVVRLGHLLELGRDELVACPTDHVVDGVAALLLEAMTGQDFTSGLDASSLRGKRIGIIRNYYGAGHPGVELIYNATVDVLRKAGAEVVDGIDIETEGMGSASYTVLQYEFKADLNRYLEESGAPVRSLAEVIGFNSANADTVMPIFGQELMIAADETELAPGGEAHLGLEVAQERREELDGGVVG